MLRQSDRLDRYAAAAERLKQSGRLYPCFESAEELKAKRDLQLKRRQAPVYDRAMLRLTAGAARSRRGRRQAALLAVPAVGRRGGLDGPRARAEGR